MRKTNIEKLLTANSYKLKANHGQSLVEVMVAVSIAAIIIGSVSVAIVTSLKSSSQGKVSETAVLLTKEGMERVKTIAEAKWHDVYNKSPKGATEHYKTSVSGTTLTVQSGDETTSSINGIIFTRYFTIENVCRTNSGRDSITGVTDANGSSLTCASSAGAEDPSTQKITANVTWPGNTTGVRLTAYITRSNSKVDAVSDWPDDSFSNENGINNSTPGEIKL